MTLLSKYGVYQTMSIQINSLCPSYLPEGVSNSIHQKVTMLVLPMSSSYISVRDDWIRPTTEGTE